MPALLLLALAGCAQNDVRPVARPEAPRPRQLVGDVTLRAADPIPQEMRLLDVGIQVFAAAPVDPDTAQVSAWLLDEIRSKETRYLPYVLRNMLVASQQWAAVRVLPAQDPSVDLMVSGTVVRSDGLTLELEIVATDSTGREWLRNTYADETANRDYARSDYAVEAMGEAPNDPFADLYARVANDLVAVRETMTDADLDRIRQVSVLRYAADLSPDTFQRMLATADDGRLVAVNLPAEDDPMLARVLDMRARHHLFIDTVDTYYESLYAEMTPLYGLWRQYSHEQILETRERVPGGREGGIGILALTQSYNRYKWAKIYEQEFAALAEGFNNEIAPAILDLNRRVHGLSGSLEEQYGQWREILRQLFELETGAGS